MDKSSWWEGQGELPGILNWALARLMRLREQGQFTSSRVCEDAAAEYRSEANPARLFLSETYETNLGCVGCKDVYGAYRDYCDDNGYRALGERTFGKEVKRAFPSALRRKIGSRDHRRWVYDGITNGTGE